jgi:dihydrofolate reductase
MSLLTIVPPMPGAERRFQPFVDFVHAAGWETEFVRLDWTGRQPNFGSTALFSQVDAQTAGKVVMGFSLGALYSHLGALRARHLTLDGCCDHQAGIPPDEETHRHATESIARADALLFGRVIYQMMESAFREPGRTGVMPDWMADWMMPFARTIHAAKKYVVSGTLTEVDWNAELLRGDLEAAVRRLKEQPGRGLFVGGVKLPLALAGLGLIDEYEFIVQPRIAGRGPTVFAGLSQHVDLKLTGRTGFKSGAVALRYEPTRRRAE